MTDIDPMDAVFTERFPPGDPVGPKVAVKDCIDIAGHVTRAGSAAFDDAPPAEKDAAVVANLRAAHCVILGKTNMHELAFGMTGVNDRFGTPVNSRWRDRIPGGSSSGSAVAAASGMCDFSIGTDTGGSIRLPAICCGVIGFKPSFGRIDRQGASPARSSLDCIGPFARDIDMIERAMAAMDPGFRPQRLVSAPRMGFLHAAAVISGTPALQKIDSTFPEYHLPLLNDAFRAAITIISRETFQAFGALLRKPDLLGADVRERLETAASTSDEAVAQAEQTRRLFTEDVDRALDRFDVLLTPAMPAIPPKLADARSEPALVLPLTRYLRPFNLSGHPALVLPSTTSDGLPIGVQLVGRKGEDAYLCAAARWFCSTNPRFLTKEQSQ